MVKCRGKIPLCNTRDTSLASVGTRRANRGAGRYQCLNFSNREEAACQTTYAPTELYLEQ